MSARPGRARTKKPLSPYFSEEQIRGALERIDTAHDIDLPGAELILVRNFLDEAPSNRLRRALTRELKWQQPSLKMFGREIKSPRLHAWHGDAGVVYRWSGRAWQTSPWVDSLANVRDLLEVTCNIRFNSCLVNRYRDGNDAMGWHADDESELGPRPVIASLNLGAVRDFDLKSKKKDGTDSVSTRVKLDNGSLLIMFGATQENYKHRIRRQPQVTGERLNLTFRYIGPV